MKADPLLPLYQEQHGAGAGRDWLVVGYRLGAGPLAANVVQDERSSSVSDTVPRVRQY